MSEPFLGEIRMFAGNFPPRGWAFCNGQIMSIASNTALFALLGTTYGGDGKTTFALPNLQSRSPLGQGQGPGLQNYMLGQMTGTESVTLTTQQLPAHNHNIKAATGQSGVGTQSSPGGAIPAISGAARGLKAYTSSTGFNTAMNASSLGVAGNSTPHNNVSPYLTVNFIIALQGIFPSRN